MPKITFETDVDKCINTLANIKANCAYKKYKSICHNFDCKNCSIYNDYMPTYNNLIPVDRLAVNSRSEYILSAMVYLDKGIRPSTGFKKLLFAFLSVLATIVIMVILTKVTRVSMLYYYLPKQVVEYEWDGCAMVNNDMDVYPFVFDSIKNVLYCTRKYVVDLNDDGEISCIDWAVAFKIVWDRQHNWDYERNMCKIVHNKNKNFNHLFISIYCNNNWYDIEPQGSDYLFMMNTVWKDRYNPLFNRYDETDYWLRRILK